MLTTEYFNAVISSQGRYEGTRNIIKQFRGQTIPGSRKHYITKERKGRYIIKNEMGQTIAQTRNMDI